MLLNLLSRKSQWQIYREQVLKWEYSREKLRGARKISSWSRNIFGWLNPRETQTENFAWSNSSIAFCFGFTYFKTAKSELLGLKVCQLSQKNNLGLSTESLINVHVNTDEGNANENVTSVKR